MSRQVIRVGPGVCSNIETVARCLSALAYPGATEDHKRQDVTAAYVASYLHQANRIDETNDPFDDPRLNAFLALSPQWCRQILRTTKRRLRDRGLMGRALRLWVTEALGQLVTMPQGLDSLTQEQISLWLNNSQEDVANNFKKRIWRPGRPVAHLAIATDWIWRSADKANTRIPIRLSDSATIERIVSLAGALAPFLCSVPRFGVTEETLLHVEWAA